MTTTISGSNGIVFPDDTSMQTGQQAVKAWVNFNGKGTVAIRASYNVSSITDNAVGAYTVNFTTAMVDGNDCVLGLGSDNAIDLINVSQPVLVSPPQTGSVAVNITYANSNPYDAPSVHVAILR